MESEVEEEVDEEVDTTFVENNFDVDVEIK